MKTVEDRFEELGTVEPVPIIGPAPSGMGEWDAGKDTDTDPTAPLASRQHLLSPLHIQPWPPGAPGRPPSDGASSCACRRAAITGEHVFQRSRVLIVSLEDDRDELRRRFGPP